MIGALVMMALGSFRFGVNGAHHQGLRRIAHYRHAELNRLGRAPATQYIGPGMQEISLEGVIYPHFKGGLRQVDLMRAQAGLGLPMMLTDGMGWVWQRWVISEVEERKTVFMADGAPRRIEFSVTLKSYGQDRI